MAGLAVLALACLAVVFAIGQALTAPANHAIGAPPLDLPAQSVSLALRDGGSVAGWFVCGKPGAGAVLLLHGVRSDRRQMVGRARFLHTAGYSVLLIDLPAHGESVGERITFGYREARGVERALAFLRRTMPGDRIGVIGVSLGAASMVFASPTDPPDAVVLESMYPTITDAVADRLRMRLGPAGSAFAPLLLWQLPVWIGLDADRLRPIDHLAELHAAVLVMGGSADLHTRAVETRRLYAAARTPRQIVMIKGAAHVDLHVFGAAAYERHVISFLQTHMRQGARAGTGQRGQAAPLDCRTVR